MNRKTFMFGLLLPLLFLVGCMTEQQVGEIRTFSEKVDGYQNIVTELKEAFVADKIINEKTAEKVDKINSWVDENQPVLEDIAVAVENAPNSVAEKVAAGVEKAAPLIPPPYNNLAVGLSSLIAILFAKRARDNGVALTKEAGKRRSEKAGTEKTIRALAANDAAIAAKLSSDLWNNIGDERARNGLT